jgi:integrase
LDVQRKPKALIRGTLTEAKIILMIAACRTIREKNLLSPLAYSGLRNKELCGWKIGDVEIVSRLIYARGGNGQNDSGVATLGRRLTHAE